MCVCPYGWCAQNTILELHWTTDGSRVITASPDRTIRAWDTTTITQVCVYVCRPFANIFVL